MTDQALTDEQKQLISAQDSHDEPDYAPVQEDK